MNSNNIIENMKLLIEELTKYSNAYYVKDNPLVTDKVYDDLMDQLEEMENESGIVLSNSPLHTVQGKVLDGFKKVKHTHQMKSANKTKDMNFVRDFISKGKTVESWKEDGLTIVCRYVNGEYIQAITRGTSGIEGEDVTESFRNCINLPLKLSKKVNVEVRGECLISWDNFNKINETLAPQSKHPRNLAAGSVRNFDTNVSKKRFLEYKAFELVQDNESTKMDLLDSYEYLAELGFDVVEHKVVTVNDYLEVDKEFFNPDKYKFAVDGTIYKYDSYEFGKSLGETEHHPLNMLARKWSDDLYETTVRDIEWNTTRSGVINPVCIFDEVSLDNCATTRATLNNVSYIENLEIGIGDTILVYRANGVIPTIHDNITRSNTYKIIHKCPYCGGEAEIRNDNGSKSLYCCNPDCGAKLISKLTHFVSKKCFNIDGLSKATLETLVDQGWISSPTDLFELNEYYNEFIKLPGFGEKSVNKLLDSINASKYINLTNFICGLGVPLIGFTASKQISKFCNNSIDKFCKIIFEKEDISKEIDGFGDKMNQSLHEWFSNSENAEMFSNLLLKVHFADTVTETSDMLQEASVSLNWAKFCVTGSLIHYANRSSLVADIEAHGGSVVDSVSKKTTYLLTNDTTSGSSKNTKAAQLGIPVITEEDFAKMIGKEF